MVEELSHASDQQTTQQTLLNPEAGGIMFFWRLHSITSQNTALLESLTYSMPYSTVTLRVI
jgi:hypothetical protein